MIDELELIFIYFFYQKQGIPIHQAFSYNSIRFENYGNDDEDRILN